MASQLIEEVTAHAQSDGLEDARGICADGTYFPNNLRTLHAFRVTVWILKFTEMIRKPQLTANTLQIDYKVKLSLCAPRRRVQMCRYSTTYS